MPVQKHSMQEYEVQHMLVSLQKQNKMEAYNYFKSLLTELHKKKAIKEENSIKINILKKKLENEPKKLAAQTKILRVGFFDRSIVNRAILEVRLTNFAPF